MNQDVILVNIMQSVVNSMVVTGVPKVHYDAGRSIQIISNLNTLDNSLTLKGTKYPLIAMILPVRERRGLGQYATVVIDRIMISTITKGVDGTEKVLTKYSDTGTYKKILYPCYYEFLKRLSWNKNVLCEDPDAIVHTKMDNPGQQKIGQGGTDYIDSIELLNLELNLFQIKTC